MARRPQMVRHSSVGYDPFHTRREDYQRCTVCGFAGIDRELWQSGAELAPISFSTDAETGRTVTNVPAFAACPLCHSPNFDGGSAPDLKW